ncbi:Ig-specific serine endopeptidase MIP [Mycoplasmoides gallisepticum]|uniref:Ig-specific serine endopeptidase MIP n=1 Tax=Mycoplasmoides gallisepticum TaxID=2096 RepID=UPI003704B093
MIKAKFRTFKYLFTLLSVSSIIVASCNSGKNSPEDPPKEERKPNPSDPSNPNNGGNPFGPGGGSSAANSISLPDPQVNNAIINGKRVVANQYPNYDAYINLNNVSKARGEGPVSETSTPNAGVTNPNDIPPEKLKEYDDKAKKLGLPTYRDAFGYGFLLPNIGEDGTIGSGLVQRKDLDGPNLIPAYQPGVLGTGLNFINLADSTGFLGLPRTILNDHYRDFSKTVYSLSYSNSLSDPVKSRESEKLTDEQKIDQKLQSYLGTTWILDYKLAENGRYPTTWYFASNMHVLENLLLPDIAGTSNDFRDFEHRNYEARTNFASLTFANYWNKDVTPTGSRFATTQPNAVTTLNYIKEQNVDEITITTQEQFDKISTPYVRVNIHPKNIKPIFLGADFLKDSSVPSERGRYSDAKTMIDFGVIEITFNNEQIAKWLTSDYANWPADKKYKFASSSLLDDKTYTDLKQNDLYAIGFPNSYDDYKIRYLGSDGENIIADRNYVSFWSNKSGNYYANSNPTKFLRDHKEQGGDLSWSNTRTFVNKPGVTDLFLSYPSFDGSPKIYSRMKYVNTGLGYLINNYVPSGGASGTRIIDSNGQIWGILYGVAKTGTSGYVTALRSEGMNYDGLYGSYNLPQYDLVYGGGKDQKDSYLDQMIKRRANEKTWLFPNGVNRNNVPDQFKFKN